MPTIALYNIQAAHDGWHQVRAPGGFEVWAFRSVQREVFAALFDGDPFDARYRQLYRRYMRRPTRVAPPLPSQFQCACVATNDDLLVMKFPAGSLQGSSQAMDVRLGFNQIARDSSGMIQIRIGSPESIACEILFDAKALTASVSLRSAGREASKFDCPGEFEHVFGTAPPDESRLPVASTLRRFRHRKVIFCSAVLPAAPG